MRRNPTSEEIERLLHSSNVVTDGFMGYDTRGPDAIIEQDADTLDDVGFAIEELTQRMRLLTEAARQAQGGPVLAGDQIEVTYEQNPGEIVCPWPDGAICDKGLTTAIRLDTGLQLQWTNLCIHLIEEHGFFQGLGSRFRLEPDMLVDLLFGPAGLPTEVEEPAGLQHEAEEADRAGSWVCTACGYLYDPRQYNQRAFEALPDDWVCPGCSLPRDVFEKQSEAGQ